MDWKQIIVGDAFRLPSRNPRYYLDLVLMVPLLFAGLILSEAVRTWHTRQFDPKEAVMSGGLVCLFLLLTKDHIRVVGNILFLVLFQSWLHFRLHGDSTAAKVSLFSGLALFLTLCGGTAFRVFILKKPAQDPEYYKKDTRTTALGIVLVLVAGQRQGVCCTANTSEPGCWIGANFICSCQEQNTCFMWMGLCNPHSVPVSYCPGGACWCSGDKQVFPETKD